MSYTQPTAGFSGICPAIMFSALALEESLFEIKRMPLKGRYRVDVQFLGLSWSGRQAEVVVRTTDSEAARQKKAYAHVT